MAVTGEITVQGKVKAVGGVPQKVEAACQAGLLRVLIPKENDAETLHIAGIEVQGIDDVHQALSAMLVHTKTEKKPIHRPLPMTEKVSTFARLLQNPVRDAERRKIYILAEKNRYIICFFACQTVAEYVYYIFAGREAPFERGRGMIRSGSPRPMRRNYAQKENQSDDAGAGAAGADGIPAHGAAL